MLDDHRCMLWPNELVFVNDTDV